MRGTVLIAALGLLTLAACSLATPDAPAQRYIVQLAAAPLVSYTGGVAGLAPTSPHATGARSVDVGSPASRAYTDYLKGQQAKLLAAVADALGRPVTPDYAYYFALDGLVLRLTSAEAARVATLPGVVSVRVDQANRTVAPEPTPQP